MTEREKGISSGDQLQATARLCSSPLVMSASAPVGFAEYSRATKSFLCSGASFCEVFSGPNAPLSQSMAIEHGSTVPGAAITKEGKGHKSELQALADVISKPMMVAKSTEPDHAIKTNRKFGRECLQSFGWPGVGQTAQLWQKEPTDP